MFSPERAEMITKGQRVEPKRTVATGYNFRFPKVDQACREMAPLFYNDEDEMASGKEPCTEYDFTLSLFLQELKKRS